MRAKLIAKFGKYEKTIHEFILEYGYLDRTNGSQILVEYGMRYGHIQQSIPCGSDRFCFNPRNAISLLEKFEEFRLRREILGGEAVDLFLLPEFLGIHRLNSSVDVVLDSGDSLQIPFLHLDLNDPKAKAILAMLGHPVDLIVKSRFGYCAYIDNRFNPLLFEACNELSHLESMAAAGGWSFFVINKFFH